MKSPAATSPKAHLTVTTAYARGHLAELLEEVARGGRVTILRYNKPQADLVPSASQDERPSPKFGTGKGRIKILDPNWHNGPQTDKELGDWIAGKF